MPSTFALLFWEVFNVGISQVQYQNASSASPCVTGWLLTGAVALITSRREVRRRSSFEGRTPLSPPLKVPQKVDEVRCAIFSVSEVLPPILL